MINDTYIPETNKNKFFGMATADQPQSFQTRIYFERYSYAKRSPLSLSSFYNHGIC